MDEASAKPTGAHYRVHRNNAKPLRGASEQDRARLGVLLQRRRSELGYSGSALARFARERDVNMRGITDIEQAHRDGFLVATLDEYARAYEVTYDSLVAVGRGEADELAATFRADEPADDPTGERLREISIERARARLGDIVDHARFMGQATVITRNGKPAAAVAPILAVGDRRLIAECREMAERSGYDSEAGGMIGELLDIIGRLTADIYEETALRDR